MGTNSSKEMLCCGITSFFIRRKDSQGCTADVKDTPPSPKEKRAMQSLESIDSGVSLKSDRSKAEPFDFKDRVSPRDGLRKSHSSGIISASVRRKDSQGCTADVKDTPPSPKQNVLFTRMAKRCMKAFDSGVSSKRVWSKRGLIDFNESSLPRMATGRLESIESSDFGVPFGINRYSSHPMMAEEMTQPSPCDLSHTPLHLIDRLRKSHSSGIISASVRRKDSQGCTADVKDTPPSPKQKRAEETAQRDKERDRRRKSHSSGIISASVRRKDSQGCTADVKDTPPSPKEKMAEEMAQQDMKREEMNQELSSEVGWKHLEAPVSSCS